MLKYLNTEITFAEVPDEITLCINITGCPNHCPDCHSQFLWEDTGTELAEEILVDLIKKNEGISCVCFMGGDQDPAEVNALAIYVRKYFPNLKIAWYSGNSNISNKIYLINFDYIKVGPYIEKLGGLDNPSTNQRFYKIMHSEVTDKMLDITNKFWKNE